MTNLPSADAITRAAALFNAAALSPDAPTAMQLHCFAALTSLSVPVLPTRRGQFSGAPDALIENALRLLGQLRTDEFADDRIRTAARHGRRALREHG